MSDTNLTQIHAMGEATGFIPAPGDKGKPITVIGTNSIRAGFDTTCLQQALNARSAPGVTDLVLNPDAQAGYGAPVGCVLTSSTHVYPGPVGVDIKCLMSFLQPDLPAAEMADKTGRRALVDANLERTPTGPGRGQRSARKAASGVDVEFVECLPPVGVFRVGVGGASPPCYGSFRFVTPLFRFCNGPNLSKSLTTNICYGVTVRSGCHRLSPVNRSMSY